ncbi:MAG TPA: tyrosine-type recombinase/integrase [Candidatus Dormibacteraeota bacterium]
MAPSSGPSQLRDAYDLFRLEKQGSLLSHWTLDYYELHLGRFFRWLEGRDPAVRRFADLDADTLRRFRAELAITPHRFGGQFQPSTLHCSHRAVRAFLRWADLEGYPVDLRLLRMPGPRVPQKEVSVYHVAQLRKMLSACGSPVEETALRILIGSGVRLSELFGLALKGPDGLPDLMIDSLDRGHAELRVRWDAGAKGKKARRVPITPGLAAHIRRYGARQRPETESTALLINRYSKPFKKGGIDAMMDRLKRSVGFRVHAHAFRHTFATVATQMGWNFERLRAAMGHSDYGILQRYVRLSAERDLGSRKDWEEFIVGDPTLRR